jgi:hypothetical protein
MRKNHIPILILLLAVFHHVSFAQTRDDILRALDTPVAQFAVSSPRPASEVLDAISRSWNIPIIMEGKVGGDVSFRVNGTRLRGVLDALCRPQGWSYEIEGSDEYAYLLIRRFVTRVYSVDYLQLKQTSSSTASVSLAGGSQSGGGYSGYGSYGNSTVNTNRVAGAGNSTGMGMGGNSGSGESSISVSSDNTSDFWAKFEEDGKRLLESGDERLVINQFAGLVQLTASLKTHAEFQTYLERVMTRVRRVAKVTVQIVRVDLNKSHKLGVDWDVASFTIGGGDGKNRPVVGGIVSQTSDAIAEIAGKALGGSTFSGVIQSGKVSALISALSQQGNVSITSRSLVSTLNNQMALVQVSEDKPLFQKQSQTTFNAGSTGVGGYTPTTEVQYTQSNVSFGNVLEITPQIDDNLQTTLSVSPSLTEYRGSVTSPDNASTAFEIGVRRYRSTFTLKNGETAIIGGFIEETSGTETRGVPGLSKIPLLGRVFRTDGKVSGFSEMVILLTVEAENPDLSAPQDISLPSPGRGISRMARDALERSAAGGDETVRAATARKNTGGRVEIVR